MKLVEKIRQSALCRLLEEALDRIEDAMMREHSMVRLDHHFRQIADRLKRDGLDARVYDDRVEVHWEQD